MGERLFRTQEAEGSTPSDSTNTKVKGMGSTFIPDRCAHIDTVGRNVLIRGNMPLLGADLHYAYDEIEAASKVDLSNMKLVEMPIIDNVGERAQFEPLLRAFGVDPGIYPSSYWPPWMQTGYDPSKMLGRDVATEGKQHPGTLIWRPFEGLPAGADPKEYLFSPGWDYSGFVDHVIALLHMNLYVPQAVYVHCQLGADRTGAFHIGYEMKAHGLSLAEAAAKANSSTSAGPPNADYQRLVAAYASTLGQ